jgi:hypothetical protein
LIAGSGQFPLLFALGARRAGARLYVAALEGEADPELGREAEEICWVPFGQIGRMVDFFRSRGVAQAAMAGGVTKANLFRNFKPDARILAAFARLTTLNDDTALRALAAVFEQDGIAIRPSTLYTPELLAPAGTLTRRAFTQKETADADFGWTMARAIGGLDIGQCVVVKDRIVLAVEAIEGTDEAVRRGARLGGPGAVVVKVAKPSQDLRFDMPSVGAATVAVMAEVKAAGLIIEAGRTLIFDRAEMIAAADRAGLSILARTGDDHA